MDPSLLGEMHSGQSFFASTKAFLPLNGTSLILPSFASSLSSSLYYIMTAMFIISITVCVAIIDAASTHQCDVMMMVKNMLMMMVMVMLVVMGKKKKKMVMVCS